MKNLDNIWGIIKKYCPETNMPNDECIAALEKVATNNSIFFPLFYYLRILQSLGLIKLSDFKMITVTEKGRIADIHIVLTLWAFAIILLHTVRRVIIVAFVFTLFWPALLNIQQQNVAHKNKDW